MQTSSSMTFPFPWIYYRMPRLLFMFHFFNSCSLMTIYLGLAKFWKNPGNVFFSFQRILVGAGGAIPDVATQFICHNPILSRMFPMEVRDALEQSQMQVSSRAVGAQTGPCQTRKFPISFSTGALFLLSAPAVLCLRCWESFQSCHKLMELSVPGARKELLELVPDAHPDHAEPRCCPLPCMRELKNAKFLENPV